MAISEKAKEYTGRVYRAYGSSTGVLFGIPPAHRAAIECIVQAVLDFDEEGRQDALLEQQELTSQRETLDEQ